MFFPFRYYMGNVPSVRPSVCTQYVMYAGCWIGVIHSFLVLPPSAMTPREEEEEEGHARLLSGCEGASLHMTKRKEPKTTPQLARTQV